MPTPSRLAFAESAVLCQLQFSTHVNTRPSRPATVPSPRAPSSSGFASHSASPSLPSFSLPTVLPLLPAYSSAVPCCDCVCACLCASVFNACCLLGFSSRVSVARGRAGELRRRQSMGCARARVRRGSSTPVHRALRSPQSSLCSRHDVHDPSRPPLLPRKPFFRILFRVILVITSWSARRT